MPTDSTFSTPAEELMRRLQARGELCTHMTPPIGDCRDQMPTTPYRWCDGCLMVALILASDRRTAE